MLFHQTCLACHGPDGKGLPNLGGGLTTSEFTKASADDELLSYLLIGKTAEDPLKAH